MIYDLRVGCLPLHPPRRADAQATSRNPGRLSRYLFGGTALKQAREHTTSASITSWTSIKEKVLDLNDPTAFPAFGKSGGVERSAGMSGPE